ncbi:hypothetical protein A7982_13581 [Minicystis rosea]|nr:hypothetical protein A7982_13581 [Minicystis rosea]
MTIRRRLEKIRNEVCRVARKLSPVIDVLHAVTFIPLWPLFFVRGVLDRSWFLRLQALHGVRRVEQQGEFWRIVRTQEGTIDLDPRQVTHGRWFELDDGNMGGEILYLGLDLRLRDGSRLWLVADWAVLYDLSRALIAQGVLPKEQVYRSVSSMATAGCFLWLVWFAIAALVIGLVRACR